MDYDMVVAGAGVIGLACADALVRTRARPRVLVVEPHASFGQETSSRSSEVVHAGMYYPTGSLKARLCVAANPRFYAYCDAHGVPYAKTGKFIVANSALEERALEEIRLRGLANGVAKLKMVQASKLALAEPRVRATSALWSPETGIVDSHAFMASLLTRAREADVDIAFQHRLVGAAPRGDGYSLDVADSRGETSRVDTRVVVNAAGLASDSVAALAGIDVDAAGYRLTYVKGRYFRVRGPGLVRSLIYPVPPPGLAGLGIHITLDLAGDARLGPDTCVLPDRLIDYDVPEAAGDAFFAAASRYLEGLRRCDLTPDQSGIRPKLMAKDGGVADFVIRDESLRGLPGWINLIGIESPGLTCALEIGRLVVRIVEGRGSERELG
jgi:L-2-hydroxyglutarate oxidase LhgO